MKPWELLSDAEKESSRRQADHIGVKLEKVGFAIARRTNWDGEQFEFTAEEVELLAKMEHQRWCDEKERDGWQPSTTRNDAEKKHDCLIPWKQLKPVDKETDRNAIRNIPKLLASLDLDIYRLN